MRIARTLWLSFLLAASLVACTRDPTPLDVPASGHDVKRFPILNGRAFQTQFTLQATYPATPALDYYRTHIPKPWVLCQWSGPEWSRFVDAQSDEHFTVFQQLYMWVNPEAQRTLMLSMRYHAPENCGDVPDNETQHILLVEYTAANVADTINQLNLHCPSNEPTAR